MSNGNGGHRTRFAGLAVGAAALFCLFVGLFAAIAATGTLGDSRPLGTVAG